MPFRLISCCKGGLRLERERRSSRRTLEMVRLLRRCSCLLRMPLRLNRCARLRGIAHGGQTVLSSATRAVVGDDLPEHATLDETSLLEPVHQPRHGRRVALEGQGQRPHGSTITLFEVHQKLHVPRREAQALKDPRGPSELSHRALEHEPPHVGGHCLLPSGLIGSHATHDTRIAPRFLVPG